MEDAFRAVGLQMAGRRVSSHYHPYKDLRHTWHLRDGRLEFRISDYLRSAPNDIGESLAWFVLCRALGEDCPIRFASRYLAYIRSPEFWNANRHVYLSRAKNLSFRPDGDAHDLIAAFEYVNTCHFNGEIRTPTLAWTRDSPSWRMGFAHGPLGIVAVNKALDSHQVPRFVVEFVIYHELLHCILGCANASGRRVFHTKEFRDREREFRKRGEAQMWLSRVVAASKDNPTSGEVVPQV